MSDATTTAAKPRNLYELYETDKDMEKKGIYLKFADSKFKVKRAGGSNRDFDTIFEARTREFQHKLQIASLTQEHQDDILMDVYFDAVMLGWEDVTDRAGERLEFNKVNFKKVMGDLPDLWNGLRSQASNMDNFLISRKKEAAAAVGNA
jgi:hypothetical protein